MTTIRIVQAKELSMGVSSTIAAILMISPGFLVGQKPRDDRKRPPKDPAALVEKKKQRKDGDNPRNPNRDREKPKKPEKPPTPSA